LVLHENALAPINLDCEPRLVRFRYKSSSGLWRR
jgi:hypothetical protein